jgi:glycerol-3-phosphate dehydrogenase (NAD(P)+)
MTTRVAVLGAGAWGTALAAHLARRRDGTVTLWARDADGARTLAHARCNERYLPGVALPKALSVTADLAAVAQNDLLIVATPMAALPELADALLRVRAHAPLVWVSKGFLEVPASAAWPAGVALGHEVLESRWPSPVGVVSGPSFAEEVARGLPTAVAVAATKRSLATKVGEPSVATRCAPTKATTSQAWRSGAPSRMCSRLRPGQAMALVSVTMPGQR